MRLTKHAHDRAVERVGHPTDPSLAVPLPRSAVRHFRGRWHRRRHDPGIRLLATATAVLVTRSDKVLTCLPLEPENLAELLTRILFSSGGKS